MRNIYFVRHSIRDTTIQEDQIAPLTFEGHQLAVKLVDLFKEKSIKHIFSSPYLRAIQTIQPIADFYQLDVALVEELHERKVGTWVANFPEFTKKQWQDFDYHLAQGESLNQVLQRILPVYQEILDETTDDIIICGHGTAFAVLFYHLTKGQFTYEEFKEMEMPDVFIAKYQGKQLIEFSKTKQKKRLTKN